MTHTAKLRPLNEDELSQLHIALTARIALLDGDTARADPRR
jgi:hypothetical protein